MPQGRRVFPTLSVKKNSQTGLESTTDRIPEQICARVPVLADRPGRKGGNLLDGQGAEPGDLPVMGLLDIGAKQDSLSGLNGFFNKMAAAASWPSIWRWRRNRSGTSRAGSPAHATCRVCSTPA